MELSAFATRAPRPAVDRVMKVVMATVLAGFFLWFFVLVRPVEPKQIFLPYESAVAAAAVLGGYGFGRRDWAYVVVAGLVILLLLLIGLFSLPLGLAECQEWVANGRFRIGAF
jgi:hypothetical protein